MFNAQARKMMDNETPEVVIEFGGKGHKHSWIMQYWTRGGVYGPQVVTVWHNAKTDESGSDKTSGCGYSKKGAGLWVALQALGVRPRGVCIENEIDFQYRIGGNLHRVPAKDMMAYSSNEKYGVTSAKIRKERGY